MLKDLLQVTIGVPTILSKFLIVPRTLHLSAKLSIKDDYVVSERLKLPLEDFKENGRDVLALD